MTFETATLSDVKELTELRLAYLEENSGMCFLTEC